MPDINIDEQEQFDPKDLVVELEGRMFATTPEPTFEQDLYMVEQLSACGFDNIREELQSKDRVTKKAANILTQAYTSGHLFLLLAGSMVELGKEWNREDAEANAAFFSRIKNRESKQILQRNLLGIVLSFSFIGSRFEKTFLKSLDESLPSPATFAEALDATLESGTGSSEN